MLPVSQPRATENCVGTIVELLENDYFEAPSDERGVEKIVSSTKEAKSSKSPACFELLAAHVVFPEACSISRRCRESSAVLPLAGGVDGVRAN